MTSITSKTLLILMVIFISSSAFAAASDNDTFDASDVSDAPEVDAHAVVVDEPTAPAPSAPTATTRQADDKTETLSDTASSGGSAESLPEPSGSDYGADSFHAPSDRELDDARANGAAEKDEPITHAMPAPAQNQTPDNTVGDSPDERVAPGQAATGNAGTDNTMGRQNLPAPDDYR